MGCVSIPWRSNIKECFCPRLLLSISDLAENLKICKRKLGFCKPYFKTRGTNRFKALVSPMNLFERKKRSPASPCSDFRSDALEKWMEKENKLGNPSA